METIGPREQGATTSKFGTATPYYRYCTASECLSPARPHLEECCWLVYQRPL